MDLKKGVYIPSIDAKDIYLASHYINKMRSEYSLKLKDGKYNLRKFINSNDYSKDLIKLVDVYHKTFRRNNLFFKIKKHWYTQHVINITFKYSVKEWNQTNKNTFVKFGYDYNELEFHNCIAIMDGEVVGVKINDTVDIDDATYYDSIEKIFKLSKLVKTDKKTNRKTVYYQYKKIKEPKTLKTNSQLRHELYKNGFTCDGIKYKRFKRSTGSARVGKCLFINHKLLLPLLLFCSGNMLLEEGQETDLAAYESYISMTSSSIIDTIKIKPENILVIDDYESVFEDDVVETHDENGWLKTSEKKCKIKNSIWDGQSLMDVSLFGEYDKDKITVAPYENYQSIVFNGCKDKELEDIEGAIVLNLDVPE